MNSGFDIKKISLFVICPPAFRFLPATYPDRQMLNL
jgi:hypothetical protein